MFIHVNTDNSLRKFYEIKTLGSLEHGDCNSTASIEPDWLEKEKFNHGKKIANDHLFGMLFSHLCGLYLLIHVKTIFEPLNFTGNSLNVSKLFGRYLSTLNRVKSWYEGDVWDQNDPAHRSVILVRSMHKKVADTLNDKRVKGMEPMSLSQYDMLVTQFAFIGLTVLYPQKFGINISDYDLECLLHFWRGIGYLLGVTDQFNLCGQGSLEEVKLICKSILNNEIIPSYKECPDSCEMSKGIILSVKPYIHLLTWESFEKYISEIIEVQFSLVLDWYSRLSYNLMSIAFNFLLRIYLFRFILNGLLKLAISSANKKKDKISQDLLKKYP